MESGDGKKVGEVKLWLHKDQVEQAELLMGIAIDYIHLLYMQI